MWLLAKLKNITSMMSCCHLWPEGQLDISDFIHTDMFHPSHQGNHTDTVKQA